MFKLYQIIREPLNICPSRLNFCISDEISLNLVTLNSVRPERGWIDFISFHLLLPTDPKQFRVSWREQSLT